jgi:MerR family transcriptional regulator, light-induced transcriptional regulator
VSIQIRLNDYPTTPLYNIKAVVQATNISPSTLRAWERRYQMCQPQRSNSGYRLYSERDVAVIRWLKAQVDAGMSISQAVAWLDKLADDAHGLESAVLPVPNGQMPNESLLIATPPRLTQAREYSVLQQELMKALLNYNEEDAEIVLSEAFAIYTVEEVGENILTPVLVDIGERWHRGELSITNEHYATSYLQQRLAALLRAVPNGTGGPLIWVGCAPGELHETGALLLTIYLRRHGYQVHYLGQNIPLDDLEKEVKKLQPAMLLFSASGINSARELEKMATVLTEMQPPRPMLGYGGQIFNRNTELRNTIPGVYMGATAVEAVDMLGSLLNDGAWKNTKTR